MKQHFVTSSDSRYACRLLVMLDSLFRHHPDAEITVLCLDDELESILRKRSLNRISIITTGDLITHEPRLAETRPMRSSWEFYATQKPVSLSMLIEGMMENECISFIDSDVWFFASSEAVFNEMAGASIGVSPNRFSKSTAHLIKYGQFGAGFGIWRNDPMGRQCLRDWSEECLQWCHERVEGSRFMNQGCLGSWPQRYKRVRILEHPGANLGPWNLETHRITYGPDGVKVDGHPLVFFHFSGIIRLPNGCWQGRESPGMRNPEMLRSVFLPYLDALDRMEDELRPHHDVNAAASVRDLQPQHFPIDLRATAALGSDAHDRSVCPSPGL